MKLRDVIYLIIILSKSQSWDSNPEHLLINDTASLEYMNEQINQ